MAWEPVVPAAVLMFTYWIPYLSGDVVVVLWQHSTPLPPYSDPSHTQYV